jgi:hypothetical protein
MKTCSFGKRGCRGERFAMVEGFVGKGVTKGQLRREAGARMLLGELCQDHARILGAIAPVPKAREKLAS